MWMGEYVRFPDGEVYRVLRRFERRIDAVSALLALGVAGSEVVAGPVGSWFVVVVRSVNFNVPDDLDG